MKFIADAHHPQRLAPWLEAEGQDVIRTRGLPLGNRTPDTTINEISLHNEGIMITKHDEFVALYLHRRQTVQTSLSGNSSCDTTLYGLLKHSPLTIL